MTTLTFEQAIARLHALPEERKQESAAEIGLLLDQDSEELLSREEWTAIEARLDEPQGFTSHAEFVRQHLERRGK